VYEGIFHALRPAGDDFDVLLRMARTVSAGDNAGERPRERPQALLAIEGADLVQLTAADVRMGAADVGPQGSAFDDAGGFGTDAAISRARGAWGRERELQRWAPDDADGSQLLQLEDTVGPVGRGWDQFAVNEAKFGVRTNYAEELYTTELDPK
jgi:PAB1-binding protein PBP1